ncbi:hypothetical protein SCUCBS95973_006018 [Sporothrix curviconia]|uniref:Dynamin GTPase domain-containing protein n=1 Tax=Sporothrix curviconia TaxID=1260050 RepID=A0ABP0C3N3_9PEZI
MAGVAAEEQEQSRQQWHRRALSPTPNRNTFTDDNACLPKVVIVGDKSSGKSSIFSALTGLSFPAGCSPLTSFAIHVQSRHVPEEAGHHVRAYIRAGAVDSQYAAAVQHLARFEVTQDEALSDDGFFAIVEQAAAHMYLSVLDTESTEWLAAGWEGRGSSEVSGKPLSDNMLVIEMSGPGVTNANIVDFPGLMHATSSEYSRDDINAIWQLASDHMQEPHTIVLAVFNATNWVTNQLVLELVQSVDPRGSRTVGVLTKCDLVPTDDQKRVLRALLNRDYYLQQGWYAVANRPIPRLPSHSQGNSNSGPASPRKRSASERLFFARYPWTALPDSRLGMMSLREGVKDLTNTMLLHDLETMQRGVALLTHQRFSSLDSSHSHSHSHLSYSNSVGGGQRFTFFDSASVTSDGLAERDIIDAEGRMIEEAFDEEAFDEKEFDEDKCASAETDTMGETDDNDDTKSEASFVLENLQEVGGERAPPEKRPTMLINCFTVALTMMLAMTLLGLGCEQLAQEFTTDGSWTRLLLLITILPQIFVCLFFCQTIINILLQLLGPVRQLKHNSKYFSAEPVRRLNIKNGPLPHVTVQCPVYMEGLDAVIKPTVASLQKAIRHYERYGGTANLFFNDDGMQILGAEAAAERKKFYAANGIGWVARPKHKPQGEGLAKFIRRGKFKKASNMNYAMGISLKVEDKLVAVDRSRGAPPVASSRPSSVSTVSHAASSWGHPSEFDLRLSRPVSIAPSAADSLSPVADGNVGGVDVNDDVNDDNSNDDDDNNNSVQPSSSHSSLPSTSSHTSHTPEVYPWTQGDEVLAYQRCLHEVLDEEKGRAWADGDIRIGDYILIIDSDTRVYEACMIDAVSELEECPEVAILQFTSGVMNVTTSFFEMGITFFTNLIYTAVRFAVANGDVAPFVGHNAFLRWSALQEISYQDGGDPIVEMQRKERAAKEAKRAARAENKAPSVIAKIVGRLRWPDRLKRTKKELPPPELDCNSTTPYEKFWSESHVSEDFDIALRLQTEGYIVRLAAYGNLGFKEGVSLTVYDELDRWEKYAYGCSELLMHPVRQWPRKGIFTPLFRRFLFSRRMAVGSKVTIMAYIGTYYAIGYAWFGCLCNYFLIGWLDGHLDHFYMDSWHVWVALVIVFSIAGNVALAVSRYRDTGHNLLKELWICFQWIPLLFIFLGGISMHVSQAILCHLLGINMSWGATAKEATDTSFFIELPIIARRFKYVFVYCIAVAILLICGMYVFPYLWRITQLVAIFPLAVMIGCHFTLPILLNPALMTFTW